MLRCALEAGVAVESVYVDAEAGPDRFLDELLAGPEPELESVGAVEALDELRVDARA